MLIIDYSIQKKHSFGNCTEIFIRKKALAPGCDFLSKALVDGLICLWRYSIVPIPSSANQYLSNLLLYRSRMVILKTLSKK